MGTTTTGFLYDGPTIVQELSGTTPTQHLLNGVGLDEHLARIPASGSASWLLADDASTTLALADGTGAVQTTYTYDPFGGATTTGAATTNPFQHAGRENDGTGLLQNRARYYGTAAGDFISEDPIGLNGGDPNLYAYAFNDPINGTDPLGLAAAHNSSGEVRIAGCDTASRKNVHAGLLRGINSCGRPPVIDVIRAGGENDAAAYGRKIHKEWDPGPGYEPGKRLENGKIPDFVNHDTNDVVELKPNNPRAIRRGERQVEGYRQQLEEQTGEDWTGGVKTYDPPG